MDCGNMLDFSLTNFTIEAWFKAHTINQLDQNTFLAKWHDISGQREFRFEIDGTGIGNVIFSTQHGTAYYELHGTTALVANTWYYAVVTVDWTGDDAYLYLNATVEDSEVNTWTQSMNYETSPVIMGSRKGVDQWFDGEIDEVRIWNVALSQSTIQDWMNKNVTSSHPNWSNLMGYWRFDEGSGYTTADGSPNSNTGTLGTVVEGDAAEPSWVWSTAFGDEIFMTVKKDGTAYYTTIQAAVDAVPADLVADGNSYIIEIQDSETYTETVTISGKTTDASHTITLKAQSGQSPTVYGQTDYRGAIHIEANYVTVDGLIVKAKGDRGDGIRLANRNYHHNTIKNCTIFNAYNSDNVAGIYVCSCHDNEIINNTIYNSLIGIRIDGDGYDYAYNNVIKNNVIYNCTYKGIWIFRGARDNTIVHNSFYSNTREIHLGHGGNYYNAGANNVFKNNMIYAKNKGHRSESYGIAVDTYGDPGSLPSGTVFDYNCIYVPDGTFAYIDNNNHSTLSAWQSATGQDAHSISSDPLLINPSTDFHLDVNSPCKNAGADIAGVTVDFEGDPRTSGSYDMGYDEYTTANDAIARKQTLTYIVKQDGTGDYTTIQAAINAVPSNLITDGNSYIVEVQDNGIYNETVTISKTTEITHDLIVRAQTGQTPEVRGQNTYSAAFNTSTNYLTLDGFIAMGGDRRNAIKVSGSYCIIRSNTAYGTNNQGYPGIDISGGHNQVEGNIVRNNQNGIVVYNYGGDYNTIKNNIVYSNTYRGIWVYRYADYNNVFHNTLYNNVKEIHIGHGGEHYDCGSNNVFKNNILHASGSGTGIAVDTYLDPGTLPSGSILDYNDIYAPSGNVGYIDNNTYNTLSNWQGGSGQDANSISTDPVFVNPTTDFHLQSSGGSYHGGAWTADAGNSPCIDAGDPTFDYSNEPIPNGYRINMGAYGNTVYASKSAPVICTYNNFPRNKWVLLGVPVIPGDGDPNFILADDLSYTYPGVNWRLSRWNAADSTYYRYGEEEPNYYDSTLPTKPAADPPDFTPGLGYWLWQDALLSTDIDLSGYQVSEGQDFSISLDGPVNGNRGLNMNANPFNFKIDWSNSKVSDGSETKSIEDA
ncbi:MAG: right-handed parallel beta-helix repeat-containing protein, partial [Candidatus Marinimicrobia bacterium]|nr:right-handed parallel beta-helix repeat-containing protein [Candidatus Neomarinimicrobiota bacterium]